MPVEVRLRSAVVRLPPDSTLRTAILALRLRPRDGALLDVEGQVIEEGRFPGYVAVNGKRVRLDRPLRDGDELTLVHAEDRTEGRRREVIPVPEGMPPNPQAFVGAVPGTQVIVRGRLSGKIASSTFRPDPDARRPRTVALTFDDGPSPTVTLRIARTLRRMGAKGTFFVVGTMVERYPDVVRKLAAMGMAVGNHSMSHPYRHPFSRLPMDEQERQIREGTRLLEKLGIEPTLFRPPGGAWSPRTLEAATRHDQRIVLWSVDSMDWSGLRPRDIARRVLRDVRPGSIVLLHDGGGNRKATLQALPRIIRGLRRMNLRPVALG